MKTQAVIAVLILCFACSALAASVYFESSNLVGTTAVSVVVTPEVITETLSLPCPVGHTLYYLTNEAVCIAQ